MLVRQALMVALGIMGIGALIIWFAHRPQRAEAHRPHVGRQHRRSWRAISPSACRSSGSGDEFDRLSESLNAMLERIEKLNEGLRQVSDNIAHDLKTPLTRLRNKAEAALATRGDDAGYRGALEEIIGESDQLIRTFNALLMISRVEAGSVGRRDVADVDLSADRRRLRRTLRAGGRGGRA